MAAREREGFYRNSTLLVAASVILSGCLMGEPTDDPGEALGMEIELTGSVGDGPIVNASMRVLTADGAILSEFESDASAGYTIKVHANNTQYPLIIDAWNGTDLVTGLTPDFALRGAAATPGSKLTANINPYSTLALELALDLDGGLTTDNIEIAQAIVTAAANGGMTTLLAEGPMFTPIDGSNIAEVIRATESLAEIVRRARDWNVAFGFSTNADLVMEALGSDLVDEVIDGTGGSRSDARTAALATVVGAQVLLESMCNELHVNGSNAAAAMQSAIQQVSSGTVTRDLSGLTVTSQMLDQVKTGLTAAAVVSSDPALTELRLAVDRVQPGMEPSLVKSILPADYRQTLENIMSLVTGANNSTLADINAVARAGGSGSQANRAPTIGGTPLTQVAAGIDYRFRPTKGDADGDTLTFSVSNKPAWLSFKEGNGLLSGTPKAADAGTYRNIVIRVTDGQASASLPAFSITVTVDAANSPPTISGTPSTSAVVGSGYSFTPTALDEDGNTLNFSVTGRPPWLNFNTSTGRLNGTPASGNVGVHGNIVVSVSDGQATRSLPAFSITVIAQGVNRAPVISGTPPSGVNVNTQFSFTPTASDPDGNPISFTVSGLPGWANFNSTTGRISGTPDDADVGDYTGIHITVSDGNASATLGPFAISVRAVSLGSVTLSWNPPTQNDDGTPLTNLSGYRFRWGTSPGNYSNSVTVNNPGITTYVVDNLAPGTYEFVATALNSTGAESDFSNTATRTVQ